MTRAFIIRPFGAKAGVNFDAVDEKLIQPALAQIGVSGNTTTEIVEQGNIREDMFRLLVCADLVIADISIHNANVFYELGIRHGMRPKTFAKMCNVRGRLVSAAICGCLRTRPAASTGPAKVCESWGGHSSV